MDHAALPARPRLHDDVVVRRHLTEHADVVVLHDHRSRHVLRIQHVQWQVLALADGTRDLDGIVLAARARGIETDPSDLREFLEHLAREGLLDTGVAEPALLDDDPDDDLLRAPLDPIEGWRFVCSGRGVCCHVFPSILFTPLEASRAMVMLPEEPHEFFPVRGAPREGAALAPLLVEGRCRYLDEGGRCQLHAAGGIDGKPAGCRSFPTQLVFDGERVRASAAFECACVVDGIDARSGEPPIPAGARTLGDLPRPTRIGRVPERVHVTATMHAARDEVRAFYRALAEATPPADVAHGLFSLARSIEGRGLAPGVSTAYSRPGELDAGEAKALIASLIGRLKDWREPLAAFRSADDLTRRALDWMIAAGELASADALPPAPAPASREARVEAFYVYATAWICRDALGALPLATALRVRAVRVWLARVLPRVTGGDPRAREPLALVEVMFRAHGLDAFVDA